MLDLSGIDLRVRTPRRGGEIGGLRCLRLATGRRFAFNGTSTPHCTGRELTIACLIAWQSPHCRHSRGTMMPARLPAVGARATPATPEYGTLRPADGVGVGWSRRSARLMFAENLTKCLKRRPHAPWTMRCGPSPNGNTASSPPRIEVPWHPLRGVSWSLPVVVPGLRRCR